MPTLTDQQLKMVVVELAQTLDELQIDYAMMGGAAFCLTVNNPNRITEDVDLAIQVDQRMITADRLTTELLTKYLSKFAPVDLFSHTIPGYRLLLPVGITRVVVLELFDFYSWPQPPTIHLQTASRRTLTINGYPVKIFSPEWTLREKILAQYERQGSVKQATDIFDLMSIMPFAIPGKPEMNFRKGPTAGKCTLIPSSKAPRADTTLEREDQLH